MTKSSNAVALVIFEDIVTGRVGADVGDRLRRLATGMSAMAQSAFTSELCFRVPTPDRRYRP